MAMNKAKAERIWTWVITIVVGILLIGLISLAVNFSRSITTEVLSAGDYEVGTLSDTGKKKDGESSMRTKNYITVDGLKIEVEDDAEVSYKVYFYDEDEDYISSTSELSTDFNSSVPSNAEYAKIVFTPLEDEDEEISFFETFEYAKLLRVTVDK